MEIDALAFIVAGAVAIVIILGVFRLFTGSVSRTWNRHKQETIERWAGEGIEFVRGPQACQFGGLESMGVRRVIRGPGYVVMTRQDLRVTRSNPLAYWIINFRQIKKVMIQPAFLEKQSKKTPFIVVRFTQEGQSDKVAFQLNEHRAWARAIARAARVKLEQPDD